jgi:hypothetical protein
MVCFRDPGQSADILRVFVRDLNQLRDIPGVFRRQIDQRCYLRIVFCRRLKLPMCARKILLSLTLT